MNILPVTMICCGRAGEKNASGMSNTKGTRRIFCRQGPGSLPVPVLPNGGARPRPADHITGRYDLSRVCGTIIFWIFLSALPAFCSGPVFWNLFSWTPVSSVPFSSYQGSSSHQPCGYHILFVNAMVLYWDDNEAGRVLPPGYLVQRFLMKGSYHPAFLYADDRNKLCLFCITTYEVNFFNQGWKNRWQGIFSQRDMQ